MNSALKAARANFRGQKATMESAGGFNDSPYVNGTVAAKIVESKVMEKEMRGITRPVHYVMLEIVDGPDKGRKAWIFPNCLDDIPGVLSCSRNIISILGDNVDMPGTVKDGQFELAIDAFLDEVEGYASELVNELVEIKINDRKAKPNGSHINPKNDKPYQSIYIQRGLGDDVEAYTSEAESTKPQKKTLDPKKSLKVGANKKKKPIAKKKVVKKKVVKKKK